MNIMAELEAVKEELELYKKIAIENSPRKTALALGHKTYEGKPCKNGHTTRSTSNNNCTQCRVKSIRKSKKAKPVKATQTPAPVVLQPVTPTPKKTPEARAIDPKIMHAHQQRKEIAAHTTEVWDEDI